MIPCTRCRSYAINPRAHGRDGSDPDLCDVCYWRKRAEAAQAVMQQALAALETGRDALAEQAAQYHAAMAGFKPARHAQMDRDVTDADAAISAMRAAAQPKGDA